MAVALAQVAPNQVASQGVAHDARRREARVPIGRVAIVRDGDEPVEVRLLDLTREGCRIESEQPLTGDTVLRLGIAGIGPVDAVVRWSDGTDYGCEFTIPLPEGAVTSAIACNVTTLPIARAIELRRPTVGKWSRPARIALLLGIMVGPWVAVGGIGLLALR